MELDLTRNPLPVTKSNQPSFLITLLSVLLLISVFIAGFFAYQTQNLVKELTKLQVTPTPIATTEPDPISNWKIFESDLKYTIKYPEYLTLKDHAAGTYFFQTDPEDYESGAFWIDERQIEIVPSKDQQVKNFDVGENEVRISCIKDFCNSELFNQIISTFKFIEAVASTTPLPVACTMEAKLCPDGSSVGRSGPKCEFLPCPTPIN